MTSIDPEQWRRAQPILDEALALPAEKRDDWVVQACGDDFELRALVQRLLAADATTGGVLDSPSGPLLDDVMRDLEANLPTRTAAPIDSATEDAGQPAGEFLPGIVLANRYRIVSLLGRGGMGEVYRADDLKLGQAVALKFLPRGVQENTFLRQRLLEEAKLARQVSHPNVCRVYDVGEWNGRHFLTMEYIDGEDLASLVKRIGHLPWQKALDIARQLCAGIHASHQLGILHRDLKPANVMLDGRGQIRITDFGLAVLAHATSPASPAGTPGYISPEQLEGHEATVRSDLYALGLVLYELFTGRRAFQARSLDEFRRLQEESSPARPSVLIDGFDQTVERAILRCLEKDPALRPASAREVALLLPGGDPVAAAIAAGQTPSPDIVAASGPEGRLRVAHALSVLAVIGMMLVVLVPLNDRAVNLGWVPMNRSADALEDNARQILERLGLREAAVDSVWGFTSWNAAYRDYVRRTDQSPNRWSPLRHPGQLDVMFFYRQAPSPLRPLRWNAFADLNDPPPRPGDVQIGTDLRGRLFWLQVISEEASVADRVGPRPEWSRLFAEADLNIDRFIPTAPTRTPPISADARAAWTGVLPEFAGYPVRVEAAALHGRPVFFELIVPWDSYWNPSQARRSAGPISDAVPRFYGLFIGSFVLVAFGAGAVLAVRNWVSGRGDRRGAFRAAAAVFCVRFAVWLVGGHHVPALALQLELVITVLGKALADAAAMWCLYVALEPYARRIHPRILISWARLFRGRFMDPLVGRDILYGVAAATGGILFWSQLYVVVPHALGLSAPPAPMPYTLGSPPYYLVLDLPPLLPLLGGRHAVAAAAAAVLRGIGFTIVYSIFILGMYFVLRKLWASMLLSLVFASAIGWPIAFGGVGAITVACSMAGALVMLLSFRYGLLAAAVTGTCLGLWSSFPITADANAPYFGTGLLGILLISGLATFGAITACRQPRTPFAI